MAWNDVLAGVFGGIAGDPMLPLKQQMMRQQMELAMQKHQQDKEKNDLMAQLLKLQIKTEDTEAKHKEQQMEIENTPINKLLSMIRKPEMAPQQGFEAETGESFNLPGPTGRDVVDVGNLTIGQGQQINKFRQLLEDMGAIPKAPKEEEFGGTSKGTYSKQTGKVKETFPETKEETQPKNYDIFIDTENNQQYLREGSKIPVGWKKYEKPPEENKNLTNEQLIAGALAEELGRKPTATEIKSRIQKEAKGYDTVEEAFAEAVKQVKAAGPDAGLVPSYELTAQNKFVPKTIPNITLRIPPFQQGVNLPPGIIFNRKTGKYSDTTTGKQFNREELINLYGMDAAIRADKMALGELTKREQLIKVFTNRIDANVPIVLDAVKDIKNTNVRLYNQAINTGKQYLVGSGKWTALQTAMRSLSNEIQRVESGQLGIGGQGEEERKIWAKFHDPNMSFKDIEEVTNMLLRLSKTATQVIEKQRQDLIKRIPEEGMGNFGETSPETQIPPVVKPTHQYIPGKGIVPMGGK